MERFNQLMEGKMQELGYVPKISPHGQKLYEMVPMHERKEKNPFIENPLPRMNFGRPDRS